MKRIILWSLLFSTFVIACNLVLPTMINEYSPFWAVGNTDGMIDDTYLVEVVQYHQDNPVFATRPYVTWLVSGGALAGLSIPQAFVLVQWLLLIGAGIALGWLTRRLYRSTPVALTLGLFYTSFSVLFAYAAPIYTYDDLLQYILLFLAIGFGYRREWGRYVVLMTLALLARESSAILLPSLLILWLPMWRDWRKVLVIVSPFGLYLALQWLMTDPALAAANQAYLTESRFAHFTYNTRSAVQIRESVMSIVFVLALPMYVVLRTWRQLPRKLLMALLVAVGINTAIALIATRIQEARIVALPLILLWPLFGQLFRSLPRKLFYAPERILLVLFGVVAAWQLSFHWYQTEHVDVVTGLFSWYVFLTLILIIFHAVSTSHLTDAD